LTDFLAIACDIVRPDFRAKSRPVTVWEAGPCDPEATRVNARDLTAVGWRFDQAAMFMRAETDAVALLVEPECRGLHADNALEAIAKVEAACADFRRLLTAPTGGEAA
jgi:hypothetical protein